MVIKSYKQVSPTSYPGVSEGVRFREIITHQVARQILPCGCSTDVQAGAGTPSTPTRGSTRSTSFQEQDACGRKERKLHSKRVIPSTSPRMNNTASSPTPPPRFK